MTSQGRYPHLLKYVMPASWQEESMNKASIVFLVVGLVTFAAGLALMLASRLSGGGELTVRHQYGPYDEIQKTSIVDIESGNIIGSSIVFFPRSTEIEAIFTYNDRGALHGPASVQHPGGAVEELCFYSDGKQWGPSCTFDTNGCLLEMQTWRRGELDGVCYTYGQDGLPLMKSVYSNGVLQSQYQVADNHWVPVKPK